MNRSFLEAIKNRRSYYSFDDKVKVSNDAIRKVLEDSLYNLPSAFNSQTSRLVLLTGDNHKKLWDITKDVLREFVPEDAFPKTEQKIDSSFRSGYGTVLFYEDMSDVEAMQKSFPIYADRFPVWSQHTSAMHQLSVWTMLEDLGLGVSLQHYNPIIDSKVAKQWNVDSRWQLVAQMPFGNPLSTPAEKTHKPLSGRLLLL